MCALRVIAGACTYFLAYFLCTFGKLECNVQCI